MEALRSEDPQLAVSAAGALASIGPAALPALREARQGAPPELRRRIGLAMGQAGSTLEDLLEDVRAEDSETRKIAYFNLGEKGPRAGEVVDELVAALEAEAVTVCRVYGAGCVRKIGPGAAAAEAVMTTYLKDADKEVRKEAAQALGAIGPAASGSVEALERLRDDPEPAVQEAAREAIRAIRGG